MSEESSTCAAGFSRAAAFAAGTVAAGELLSFFISPLAEPAAFKLHRPRSKHDAARVAETETACRKALGAARTAIAAGDAIHIGQLPVRGREVFCKLGEFGFDQRRVALPHATAVFTLKFDEDGDGAGIAPIAVICEGEAGSALPRDITVLRPIVYRTAAGELFPAPAVIPLASCEVRVMADGTTIELAPRPLRVTADGNLDRDGDMLGASRSLDLALGCLACVADERFPFVRKSAFRGEIAPHWSAMTDEALLHYLLLLGTETADTTLGFLARQPAFFAVAGEC